MGKKEIKGEKFEMSLWVEILGGTSREDLPEKGTFERINMRELAWRSCEEHFRQSEQWGENMPSVIKNEQGVCIVRSKE